MIVVDDTHQNVLPSVIGIALFRTLGLAFDWVGYEVLLGTRMPAALFGHAAAGRIGLAHGGHDTCTGMHDAAPAPRPTHLLLKC